MNEELKSLTKISILLAVSIILSIIEWYIPLRLPAGVKLGFANVISVICIYTIGYRKTLGIVIFRIVIVAMLSGFSLPIFLLSLSGGIGSVTIMFLVTKLDIFSVVGVSFIGSITHSIFQILMAMILISSSIVYYLPVILILCVPTGILVGLISKRVLELELI